MKNKTYHKRKVTVVFVCAVVLILGLLGRLVYLMIFDAAYYQKKAEELHERERDIKAARGEILDRTGKVLATNETVCTISVIHSQIEDAQKVTQVLAKELDLSEEEVAKKVEKISSMERIQTNVEKEVGDRIRAYELQGVKVDEDFRRCYPYGNVASKVLGFTGGDNQGIIGLEVKYEAYLKGENGKILTKTDARGIELEGVAEGRKEPIAGNTLKTTLDYNIQTYAQQMAEKVMEEKQADKVAVLLMNPQNGEIYAMVNVPEFDLNEPFTLTKEVLEQEGIESDSGLSAEKKQELLNQMWRNGCINDTYEPGSTFKIITTSACLEAGVTKESDTFFCPGYKMVEDRRIRCHKRGGHGSETLVEGVQNSCNPVFMEIGMRLGVDAFYDYFGQFGLFDKTGIDLPGEAGTIMHKKENIKAVELATMTFGQSFQITPIQLASVVSALVNGGQQVTPHFAMEVLNEEGDVIQTFPNKKGKRILEADVSETMQTILESVVSEGSGENAYLEGYHIGGKTATSQTLPRSANKYISSFIGFAPADDPVILGLCVIYDPQGIYYGGTIAAPVIRDIFDAVLPYLGVEKEEVPEEKVTQEE